ncbi:S8 family serine peptidase [candidate division CSSED10-310 bacterium]|uniref:S8 family serine peptidase n=1 Tax=candidate division CSSED10-310 bacterium TaxID=2855610 RepID=A0ABV6YYH1_UNCC1
MCPKKIIISISALIFVSTLCFAQDPIERKLDPRLKILYRAQKKEIRKSVTQAKEVVRRLALLKVKDDTQPLKIPVLVKYLGDKNRLKAYGLRVQAKTGAIYSGVLSADYLLEFMKLPGIHYVQLSQHMKAYQDQARRSDPPHSSLRDSLTLARGDTRDLSGTGVIIGFIDTGVDIWHEDFRNGDGTTRIKYLLDFSDPGDTNGDGELDGLGPFGGTLYDEADINAALQSSGTVNEVDTTGHGTHGLSVAAGDDPTHPGLAPAADLIVVKATREADTLGFWSVDTINALTFIDQKADELGQPYVTNLSLGTIFASHDGKSLEEQAIDALVGPGVPGKTIVCAAGNSSNNHGTHYHHFKSTSYVGYVDATNNHTLTVPVYTENPGKGNDRIMFSIWYEGNDKNTITVTSPNGENASATFGNYTDTPTPDGDIFIANMGGANPLNGDMEAIIMIDDWSGLKPAEGDWTITFTGVEIGDTGVYHGWLDDNSMVGDQYPYLSANADNEFLVAKPGCAYHSITVGSFAKHEAATRFLTSWDDVGGNPRTDATAILDDISDFSSPGPTRDGRKKPELTAPGERVMGAVSQDAYPGISAASIYQYHSFPAVDALIVDNTPNLAFGMLQGTSFSAPVVTGLAARILSTDPSLDAIQIRNILLNSATSDGLTGTVPNNEWGYGKVDLTIGEAPLPQNLRITTDELPDGVVGFQYNHVLTAAGGVLPYEWILAGGSLPDGLILEDSGFLTGVPTTPGTFNFTIQVEDEAGIPVTDLKSYEVEIAATPPFAITTTHLSGARIDEIYEFQLQAEGGSTPYTWSIEGSDLPFDLTMDGSGRISGTPITPGTSHFTVKVQDSILAEYFRSLKIKVYGASGQDWEALGKSTPSINQIVIDPNDSNRILVSTMSIDAIFESTNNGDSWQVISINNNLNDNAEFLTVSPVTSTPWLVQYLGKTCGTMSLHYCKHLYKYDSATTEWLLNDVCNNYDRDLFAQLHFDDSDNAYIVLVNGSCGAWPIPDGTFLYKSSDSGNSWDNIGRICDDMNQYQVYEVFFSLYRPNPDYLYTILRNAVQMWGYVLNSIDGGSTWNDIKNNSSGLHWIEVSQTDPMDVIKCGFDAGGIYAERSIDGGRNWLTYYAHDQGSVYCLKRSHSNPALLLLGTSEGLFKSIDNGLTWSQTVISESGGTVTAIDIDRNDADISWVATDAGLYTTHNGGQTWEKKNNGLLHRQIFHMVINANNAYEVGLATAEGPYLSRTSGNMWTLCTEGLSDVIATHIAISKANPDLYFISTGDGVYRSDNKGVTWTQPNATFDDGASVLWVKTDPFDENVVFATLSGTRGNYRSDDKGVTWNGKNVDLPFTEPTDLDFAQDVPDRLYVSYNDHGIYRSDNRGESWYEFGLNSETITSIEPVNSNSNYVYAAAGSTMYYYDGSIWNAALTNPVQTIICIVIDPNNANIAYAGADHPGTGGNSGGIYKTTDGGANWTFMSGPLDSYDVVSIATHPSESNTVYAATFLGGAYVSTDGASSWLKLSNYGTVADLTNINVLQDPTNPFLLFAGTEGYGVQVSADDGRSFSPRVNGLTNLYINVVAFDPDDPSIVYAGTDAGVFKSPDSGLNWTATSLTTGEVTDMVTDNEGAAHRLWSTVRGEGVAFSDNGGDSFSMYSTGLASLELTSIALEDTGTAHRLWSTMLGGDGVAFSDDLGQTWQSGAGNGLTDRDVYDLGIESGTAHRLWSTTASGVFFSDNEGQSWSELSTGLPSSIPVTSVSIDPNTNEVLVSLYGEEGGGVYRGGNIDGVWDEFNSGLDELKVKRLTNDHGQEETRTSYSTTFYAATRGDGVYATKLHFDMTVPPLITTHHLPKGLLRLSYTTTLAAEDGTPPYYWSVHENSLPSGLILDRESGVISGEPAYTGFYTFTVQVSDANQQINRKDFTMEVVAADELQITHCSPEVGARGQTLVVTIHGSAFQDPPGSDFGAGVTVNSTLFVSANELTANVSVASDATPGWRTVTVTNPDLSTTYMTDCFKVDYPTPAVSSIDPTQGSRKTTLDVTVYGNYFESGCTVDMGDGIAINTYTYTSSTELTVEISIQSDAPLGLHAVTVTNPNDLSDTLPDAFDVWAAEPTVTSCDPVQANQGSSLNVIIYGDDFQTGASSDFGAGITVNNTTVDSATQITANISIDSGAALGFRTVSVTNPDTQSAGLGDAFKVMGPAPQVISLNPVSADRGSTLDVIVSGTNFQTGAVCNFGADISVNETIVNGPGQITADITIDAQATLGYRNVTVTNADNQSATKTDAFEIEAVAPAITLCNPDQGNRGSTLDVIITGTNFLDGVTTDFGSGIAVNSTTFGSESEVTANITIEPGAIEGPRNVTVTNPDSKYDILTDGFEVLITAPEVTLVVPNMGYQAETLDVAVKGNFFVDGAQVSFGDQITVHNVTYQSVTRLDTNITIAPEAEKVPRTIIVTNPDSQEGSLVDGFSVLVPPYAFYECAYNWIDITTRNNAGLVGDDVGVTIPIGFTFCFYGEHYDQVTISSNGYLTFSDSGEEFLNTPLPSEITPDTMIAVFWDDLEVPSADMVTYEVLGNTPDRKLVIQWTNVPLIMVGGGATFQVIIHEQKNEIIVQYQDVVFDHPAYDYGQDATIGIECETGLEGLQIGYNSPVLSNETAYLITQFDEPTPPVPGLGPLAGLLLVVLFSVAFGARRINRS